MQFGAGKQNIDADALSRRPHSELTSDYASQKEQERISKFAANHLSDVESSEMVLPEVVKAICERHDVYSVAEESGSLGHCIALVESLALNADVLPLSFQDEHDHGLPLASTFLLAELSEKQNADPSIREIIIQIKTGESPAPTLRKELPEVVLKSWSFIQKKTKPQHYHSSAGIAKRFERISAQKLT